MRGDRSTLVRKMLILLGLSSCLLLATPSVARADCWDDCFACHDECDRQEWLCATAFLVAVCVCVQTAARSTSQSD
jgi:hypothetical protein